MSGQCQFSTTCKSRMRNCDNEDGCTTTSSIACDAARYNRIAYPVDVKKHAKTSNHGCYNKPRAVIGSTYKTWNGEKVIFTMSTECKYDKSETDKNCAGCLHVKTEETK